MLIFSKPHNWQGSDAVKQILVFPSQTLKDEFDVKFKNLLKKDNIENVSDSNIGALYKIRAIKNINKQWDLVIRCGITGELLFNTPDSFPTPRDVFMCAMHFLGEANTNDLSKQTISLKGNEKDLLIELTNYSS